MQEVTMTVQVPIELKNAFMARVQEEKKPASNIILDLMRNYAERQENVDEQEKARRKKNDNAAMASVELSGYEIAGGA